MHQHVNNSITITILIISDRSVATVFSYSVRVDPYYAGQYLDLRMKVILVAIVAKAAALELTICSLVRCLWRTMVFLVNYVAT